MLKSLVVLVLLYAGALGSPTLYKTYCSSCHGEDRLGWHAPPLLPPFLSKSDEKLYRIIREGSRNMPSFPQLSDEEIKSLIAFIKSPVSKVDWSEERIKGSEETLKVEKPSVKDVKNMTFVVERGKDTVWVMEGEKVLTEFPFSNMHGGIKFSRDGRRAYIPSRDGWVGLFSGGELKRVKACVYLRNIALSSDGETLVASCWLPPSFVFFDKDLNLIKVLPIEGRVSAVYELWNKPAFVFTLTDKPFIGMIDAKTLQTNMIEVETPLRDFAVDPLERYLIGSSEREIIVYDLESFRVVKRLKGEGIPHLASLYFWYAKGDFYFITPTLNRPYASVWKAYRWEHVKDVPLKGQGFLARSSYKNPYVWMDTGSDRMLLLDKRTLDVKEIKISEGKKVTHAEFSSDGSTVYLSVYDDDGELALYNGFTLQRMKSLKASYPAGKYNLFNKLRYYDAYGLGYQVFMEKCWGCHHLEKTAFGPALRWSVKHRDFGLVLAQVLDPAQTYRLLGYERSAMPKIHLSEEEFLALKRFLEVLRDE